MDLSNLNSEQQKAVKHIDGPLLILAGAGSGKTTTMTHRIAYMIEQGVNPAQIMAVTFTNKAAGEMRDRVESLVPRTRGMWIMTFHAMCLRMLRYQSEVLGYKTGFTVYDETDRKSLVKRIMKALEINEKTYPVSYVISVISNAKEREQNSEKYIAENSGDFRANTVYQVYREYEKEMMRNNAMDFDDLILNGVRLLEADPEILAYYRNRFQYIMVDEYQDTNYLQYKLIHLLSKTNRNLCVVGDDDQCIYQWRGADIRNILDFEKDFPEVTTIKLEQNYRSDGNILNLANSVICNNKGRKEKALWTEKKDGAKITYRRLPDEKQEAWYIGSEIDRLHEAGYPYSDMAVLYRKNAQSRAFEEKFSFRGIPYRVLAGLRFYDRKEIKDVMAYMHRCGHAAGYQRAKAGRWSKDPVRHSGLCLRIPNQHLPGSLRGAGDGISPKEGGKGPAGIRADDSRSSRGTGQSDPGGSVRQYSKPFRLSGRLRGRRYGGGGRTHREYHGI